MNGMLHARKSKRQDESFPRQAASSGPLDRVIARVGMGGCHSSRACGSHNETRRAGLGTSVVKITVAVSNSLARLSAFVASLVLSASK